ncbi:hypothetical protein N3K66_005811 [Trichothecium roseum]|uniref:Uncharacterized protein n=1 Tax=Trichothecium roseum TaxID=47278 RepID=A0ACC0UZM9_9HYPO|nr:hypothetical protein N3K66_005811 [Trichothecium roseum]
MAALDNANPTILSASQLPTRQSKKASPRAGPDSKYSDVIFARPSYLEKPFNVHNGTGVLPGSGPTSNDDAGEDAIDEQEIYDLIATISDPEHPVSLGQLSVINLPDIHISPSPALGNPPPNAIVTVTVDITPTITHCSLATVIGLGVRVRLERALPPNYRVVVRCKQDSHAQDDQVNKQLGDKERVAAALENDTLKGVLDKMLETCVNA